MNTELSPEDCAAFAKLQQKQDEYTAKLPASRAEGLEALKRANSELGKNSMPASRLALLRETQHKLYSAPARVEKKFTQVVDYYGCVVQLTCVFAEILRLPLKGCKI